MHKITRFMDPTKKSMNVGKIVRRVYIWQCQIFHRCLPDNLSERCHCFEWHRVETYRYTQATHISLSLCIFVAYRILSIFLWNTTVLGAARSLNIESSMKNKMRKLSSTMWDPLEHSFLTWARTMVEQQYFENFHVYSDPAVLYMHLNYFQWIQSEKAQSL